MIMELTEEELRARLEKVLMQKEMAKKKEAMVAERKKKLVEQNGGKSSASSGSAKDVVVKGDYFSCGRPGHVESQCPSKMADLGLHLCGYEVPGQMFHSIHVEVDEGEMQLNQSSGILHVLEGEADVEKIIQELCALYDEVEVWTVKQMEPKYFLIVFPNKEMRKGLTRFKKGSYFVTQDIKALVVDSNLDAEAFDTLSDV
jgi:hypothetical protein